MWHSHKRHKVDACIAINRHKVDACIAPAGRKGPRSHRVSTVWGVVLLLRSVAVKQGMYVDMCVHMHVHKCMDMCVHMCEDM